MAEKSFTRKFIGHLGYGAINPAIWGAAAVGAHYARAQIAESDWMKKQLEEAKAADEAYYAELQRAYKHTFPEDKNITQQELREFGDTARGLDDRYLYSTESYQKDIYNGLKDLYGSPHGTLQETYNESLLNLGELVGYIGFVAAWGITIVAGAKAVALPFKAYDRATWW